MDDKNQGTPMTKRKCPDRPQVLNVSGGAPDVGLGLHGRLAGFLAAAPGAAAGGGPDLQRDPGAAGHGLPAGGLHQGRDKGRFRGKSEKPGKVMGILKIMENPWGNLWEILGKSGKSMEQIGKSRGKSMGNL